MRTRTLGVVLCVACVVACSIDRPSNDLTCSTTADCTGFSENRACAGGYCIVPNCPADCTSCDEAAMTCQVDCTTAASCTGDVTCPSGWTCTISCVGDGACNNVECQTGSTCSIACTGDNACRDVRCSNACKCDLDCLGGACASMSCPVVGGGANQVRCTADGTNATECDSARDSRCTKC